MKQMYYTSCKKNDGLQDRPGLQIRAASASTSPGILQAAVKYCYYYLPFGQEYRTDIVQPEATPIRFAFLQTADLGPIALQAVYAGTDPASGRPGNPFVHLVCDDTEGTLDAWKVLSSWQSPFWKRNAPDERKELAGIGDINTDGIDESILVECAEEERWRQNVAFLFDAIQGLHETGQIFVVGEPPEIVGMLLAIARALPHTLRKTFTFTTYEKDIEGQYGKVVGTWWGSLPNAQDLPDHCYAGRRVGMNLKSSRRSEGIRTHRYTQYILDCIVKDTLRESVDPFLHFCEECGLASISELDHFFQLHQATQERIELKQEHLEVAFANERSLPQVCASAIFRANVLAAMEHDDQFRRAVVDRFSNYLTRDCQAADAFDTDVYQELVGRVRNEDDAGLRVLRQAVLPILPQPDMLWVRLFRELSEERTSIQPAGNVHLLLLESWSAVPTIVEDREHLGEWFLVSSERIEAMLAVLPTIPLRAWAVFLNFNAGCHLSESVIHRILQQPELVAAVFEMVGDRCPDKLPNVARLFHQGASTGYLELLLGVATELHPAWVIPFLSTIDPAREEELLARQGPRLLPVFGRHREFQQFLVSFECHHAASLGRSATILELYNTAIRERILDSQLLIKRVEAWNFIKELKDIGVRHLTPYEIHQRLACLCDAPDTTCDCDVYQQVFLALISSPIRDLENIVYEFGPSILRGAATATSTDIRGSWVRLCKAAVGDRRLESEPGVSIELLRIRAGVTTSRKHNGRVFLEAPELEPVGMALLKSLPTRARNQLERHHEYWPSASRRLWRQWSQSNKGLLRTVWNSLFRAVVGKGGAETTDTNTPKDRSSRNRK